MASGEEGSIFKFITNHAAPLGNNVFCKYGDKSNLVLQAAILLKLAQLERSMLFGAEKFTVTPFTLTSTPQKVLTKDIAGRVRNVSFWVDSASGGPTPTIRIGTSASSSNSGGARISAGQVNEFGNVSPDVELYAVSDTSIVVYVVERA